MAGPPNGPLRSAADAKDRLLELGRREHTAASLLGSPLVRAGAMLAAGALVATMLRHRGKESTGASFRKVAIRAGIAAAPLLVEQFVSQMKQRDGSRRRASPDPSQVGYTRGG